MTPYPLLFEPILKERVWGGRGLEGLGKTLPPKRSIGESWELADLPGNESVVRNGPLSGTTLHQALHRHREWIMGAGRLAPQDRFPLLIKFLDARENLSVQVHPTPEYAARHPGCAVKSEAWYVMSAKPGAVIYKGLRTGCSPQTLRAHIGDGSVAADLLAVPAIAGACHHLPSGTIHALGAGVLVAEVQTASDTTFRLFDWGRQGRTLHIDDALECIDFAQTLPMAPARTPPPHRHGSVIGQRLLRTGDFTLERITAGSREAMTVVTNGTPEIWMVLAGSASIRISGAPEVDLSSGTTMLVPARCDGGEALVSPGCTILRVTLPSPLQHMIAGHDEPSRHQ